MSARQAFTFSLTGERLLNTNAMIMAKYMHKIKHDDKLCYKK